MAIHFSVFDKLIYAICKLSKRHRKPASVQGRQFLYETRFSCPACPNARLHMAIHVFAFEKIIYAICKLSKRHRKPASVQGRQFLYVT